MKKRSVVADLPWTAKQTDDAVLTVTVKCVDTASWQWSALLLADVHFDSIKCDRQAFMRLNAEAAERGAAIFVFGDFFDAMQGKFDKRSSKAELRPEYRVANYPKAIVQDAAEKLSPYIRNYAMVSEGNHETALRNRSEIDLTDDLTTLIRLSDNINIWPGPYAGFIRFRFVRGLFPVGRERVMDTIDLAFHHGSGGDPAITRGMIAHQRMSTYLMADIIVTGHNHEFWQAWDVIRYVSQSGKQFERSRLHLKVPTLKDGYGTKGRGFDVERLKPKPLGAWWLNFFYCPINHIIRFKAEGLPEFRGDKR